MSGQKSSRPIANMEPGPFVTAEWLAARLGEPDLRILDASYFVPGGVEAAFQQYRSGHIPGAVFFDINAIADVTKSKEHAFPNAKIFADAVGKLGIGDRDLIVVYDHIGGVMAAARVWFMFRAFGHRRVALLDGGRRQWLAGNRPLSTQSPSLDPAPYVASIDQGAVVSKDIVLDAINGETLQLLDARSKGRYQGSEPEPRPRLRSGHIPSSRNLPAMDLIDSETHLWKSPREISALFQDAGIDLDRPLTTTCGSGVTACALAFGAYLAGKTDTAIYDGSWLEWGADSTLPLEIGPPRKILPGKQ